MPRASRRAAGLPTVARACPGVYHVSGFRRRVRFRRDGAQPGVTPAVITHRVPSGRQERCRSRRRTPNRPSSAGAHVPRRRPSLLALATAACLVAGLGLGAPAAAALGQPTVSQPTVAAQDANPRPDDAPLPTTFPDPTNPTGCDRTMVEDRAA